MAHTDIHVPGVPDWRRAGFRVQPDLKQRTQPVAVYRVTGFGSTNSFGNCFFVPRLPDVDPKKLTRIELEHELNAALWGNGFERMQRYLLNRDVWYWRGLIAQEGPIGDPATEWETFVPTRDLVEQVTLVIVESGTVKRIMEGGPEVEQSVTKDGPPWQVRPGKQLLVDGGRGDHSSQRGVPKYKN